MGRRNYGKKHREFLNSVRPIYDKLLQQQDGHCALCPRIPSTSRRLDIDHNHKLMVVRGLLCHRCNRVLAAWIDSDWLRRAADYLERKPVEIKEK